MSVPVTMRGLIPPDVYMCPGLSSEGKSGNATMYVCVPRGRAEEEDPRAMYDVPPRGRRRRNREKSMYAPMVPKIFFQSKVKFCWPIWGYLKKRLKSCTGIFYYKIALHHCSPNFQLPSTTGCLCCNILIQTVPFRWGEKCSDNHSCDVLQMVGASVTRLGYFWKVFATNVLTKIAQILSNFSGYLEKALFK